VCGGAARGVLWKYGVFLTLLLAYFFVTIAVSVELPAGLLPDTKPGYRAVKSKKNRLLVKAAAGAWRTSESSRPAMIL